MHYQYYLFARMADRIKYRISKINQFNDNVKELIKLDFSSYVKTNRGIGTTYYGNGRKPKTEWPSEDSVGNFMRILRFLMYDGTEKFFSCSILGNNIQSFSCSSQPTKEHWARVLLSISSRARAVVPVLPVEVDPNFISFFIH
jgi:hypothetical protein